MRQAPWMVHICGGGAFFYTGSLRGVRSTIEIRAEPVGECKGGAAPARRALLRAQ
jgi:hypothetical protein